MITLFHGTSFENFESILKHGLFGGDNRSGGSHGVWEVPTLFLTEDHYVAKKYGDVLRIDISLEILEKLGYRVINDGLGDRCYVLEDVVIPAEYIVECDCFDCVCNGECDECLRWGEFDGCKELIE